MENIIVTKEENFKVSDKDLDLLLDSLENPPKLSEKLVNAAKAFRNSKCQNVLIIGEPAPRVNSLLFNQAESDKALLADKRVRKMFFESFRKDFEMAQKKTNEYDFNKWFNQKLKELE